MENEIKFIEESRKNSEGSESVISVNSNLDDDNRPFECKKLFKAIAIILSLLLLFILIHIEQLFWTITTVISIFKPIDDLYVKCWITGIMGINVLLNIFKYYIEYKESKNAEYNYEKISKFIYRLYTFFGIILCMFYIIYYSILKSNEPIYQLYLASTIFSIFILLCSIIPIRDKLEEYIDRIEQWESNL